MSRFVTWRVSSIRDKGLVFLSLSLFFFLSWSVSIRGKDEDREFNNTNHFDVDTTSTTPKETEREQTTFSLPSSTSVRPLFASPLRIAAPRASTGSSRSVAPAALVRSDGNVKTMNEEDEQTEDYFYTSLRLKDGSKGYVQEERWCKLQPFDSTMRNCIESWSSRLAQSNGCLSYYGRRALTMELFQAPFVADTVKWNAALQDAADADRSILHDVMRRRLQEGPSLSNTTVYLCNDRNEKKKWLQLLEMIRWGCVVSVPPGMMANQLPKLWAGTCELWWNTVAQFVAEYPSTFTESHAVHDMLRRYRALLQLTLEGPVMKWPLEYHPLHTKWLRTLASFSNPVAAAVELESFLHAPIATVMDGRIPCPLPESKIPGRESLDALLTVERMDNTALADIANVTFEFREQVIHSHVSLSESVKAYFDVFKQRHELEKRVAIDEFNVKKSALRAAAAQDANLAVGDIWPTDPQQELNPAAEKIRKQVDETLRQLGRRMLIKQEWDTVVDPNEGCDALLYPAVRILTLGDSTMLRYPSRLAAWLQLTTSECKQSKVRFILQNFAIRAKMFMNDPYHSYRETDGYKLALTYRPDIVIVGLGTNDARRLAQGNGNVSSLEEGLRAILRDVTTLSPSPEVLVLTPFPRFDPRTINVTKKRRIVERIVGYNLSLISTELYDTVTPSLRSIVQSVKEETGNKRLHFVDLQRRLLEWLRRESFLAAVSEMDSSFFPMTPSEEEEQTPSQSTPFPLYSRGAQRVLMRELPDGVHPRKTLDKAAALVVYASLTRPRRLLEPDSEGSWTRSNQIPHRRSLSTEGPPGVGVRPSQEADGSLAD